MRHSYKVMSANDQLLVGSDNRPKPSCGGAGLLKLAATGLGLLVFKAPTIVKAMAVRRALLSAKSYTASMSALAQRSAWKEVMALFIAMKEHSIEPDAFSFSVVTWFASAFFFAPTFCHSHSPRSISVAFALPEASSACEKASMWQLALENFNEMQRSEVRPNVVNVASAISACGRGAQWNLALDLMEELPVLKLEADTALCNSVMSACSRATQWQRSLSIFEVMRSAEFTTPSLVSFGAVAGALEKGQQWQKAIQLLDELPRPSAKTRPSLVVCFNTVLNTCEKAHQWVSALEIFRRMQEEELKATVITWNTIMTACEKAHEWQVSLCLLRQMMAEDVRPTKVSFSIGISSCQYTDHAWPMVFSLLDEARKMAISLDAFTYHDLISAAGASGEWPLALFLLHEMKDQHLETSHVSFTKAMAACNATTAWPWALVLLDMLKESTADEGPGQGKGISSEPFFLQDQKQCIFWESCDYFQKFQGKSLLLVQIFLTKSARCALSFSGSLVLQCFIRRLPLWRLLDWCVGLASVSGAWETKTFWEHRDVCCGVCSMQTYQEVSFCSEPP